MANSADSDLPQFESSKVYLVSGKSLNAIVSAINAKQVKVVQGGGLKIASTGEQGTFLATDLNTLDLVVCIDGVATTKTFYVAA